MQISLYSDVQVLSESVSKALLLTGGNEVKETANFVSLFDRFFDCLNVSNFTNGTKNRKPFQHPYRHSDDHRLKVNSQQKSLILIVLSEFACSGWRENS